MFFVLMVTSASSVAVLTALCYWLKWTKWYVVSAVQFIGGTLLSFAIAGYATRNGYQAEMAWVSAGLCGFLALLFGLMRLLFGPLDSPAPGIADRKYQERLRKAEERQLRKTRMKDRVTN